MAVVLDVRTRSQSWMFIWRSSDLNVHTPGNVAGDYTVGSAEFGQQLIGTGLSGTVVQAFDAANTNGPSISDCCTPITNAAAVTGRIAMIDRGDCFFVVPFQPRTLP